MKIRVYYEDTDAGRIVYHTNYIKYCERARSELFFVNNINPLEGNAGFVVRHIDADFLAPARLGDILEVKTSLLEKRKSYIILKQEIYKKSIKVFMMDIKLAYIDDSKISKIPHDILVIIDNMLQ